MSLLARQHPVDTSRYQILTHPHRYDCPEGLQFLHGSSLSDLNFQVYCTVSYSIFLVLDLEKKRFFPYCLEMAFSQISFCYLLTSNGDQLPMYHCGATD